MNIITLLLKSGVAVGGGEARRMVKQGAIRVNSRQVRDAEESIEDVGIVTINCGRRKPVLFNLGTPRAGFVNTEGHVVYLSEVPHKLYEIQAKDGWNEILLLNTEGDVVDGFVLHEDVDLVFSRMLAGQL